ncbi:hypothetical protein GAY28_02095 [Azospirillum brasilense]|nr:hypothetical protein [Azospirillum brasilense]
MTAHLGICAILKNEYRYIFEWISYHKSIGVSEFILYDNISNDGTSQLLMKLHARGVIERVEWPSIEGISPQTSAYTHCITSRVWEHNKFLAFIDLDEFIHCDGASNVSEYISKLENDVGGIAVNQKVFGSAGLKEYEPRPVIERFQRCAQDDYEENRWFKSICRPAFVKQAMHAHAVELKQGRYVDVVGKNISDDHVLRGYLDHVCRELRVFHYILKSRGEFEEKRKRGGGMAPTEAQRLSRHNDEYFTARDTVINVEKCSDMDRALPRMREEEASLKRLLLGRKSVKSRVNWPNPHMQSTRDSLAYLRDQGLCIEIGEYTYGKPRVYYFPNDPERNFVIGKYCSIGPDVSIYIGRMGSHPTDLLSTYPVTLLYGVDDSATYAYQGNKNVIIGNDVWIGAGVTIMAGVTIGDGAVIGAGAVVTSDIQPYGIAVGVPAKVRRYRFPLHDIGILLALKWWDFAPEVLEANKDCIFNSCDMKSVAGCLNELRQLYFSFSDKLPEAVMPLIYGYLRGRSCSVEFGENRVSVVAAALNISKVLCVTIDKSHNTVIKEAIGRRASSEFIGHYVDIGETVEHGYPLNDNKKESWRDYFEVVWEKIGTGNADFVFVGGRFNGACALAAALHARRDAVVVIKHFFDREWLHGLLRVFNVIDYSEDMAVLQRKSDIEDEKIHMMIREYEYDPR